jgi:hypothetical protein
VGTRKGKVRDGTAGIQALRNAKDLSVILMGRKPGHVGDERNTGWQAKAASDFIWIALPCECC